MPRKLRLTQPLLISTASGNLHTDPENRCCQGYYEALDFAL